jgi:hypothetical protein
VPVLLASRLVGVDRVVLSAYDEQVLLAPGQQGVGQVGRERGLPALVRHHQLPVTPHLGVVVDRTEMQQDPLAGRATGDELVVRHRPAVPHHRVELPSADP